MALRGTLTHRKTRRLASALGIDQCRALGILESLWHVCAENQADGGIGRMADQDIADEMYYGGDAGELIKALMKSGWLDAVENTVERGRLFVHDWHEHADDSVNAKLIQWTKCYANGEPPRLRKLPKDARERVAARFVERYGAKIWVKLESLRKDENLAHIQSQIPEPEPDSRGQRPEPVCATAPDPPAEKPEPAKPPTVIRGDDAFERMYSRHPRKKDRGLAQTNLAQSVAAGASLVEIDRVHALYCEREWVGGEERFAPSLAQWLLDKGWLYEPKARDPPGRPKKPSVADVFDEPIEERSHL